MNEADPARLADAAERIRDGLRSHALDAASSRRSVQLADQLAVVHKELDETQLAETTPGKELGAAVGSIDTDRLHGLRKVTEVVKDDLSIDLGHSKLVRATKTASTFTSMYSFALAGHSVLRSATALDNAHAAAGSISEIEMPRFFDFYRSLAIFLAEGMLFWTPMNFRAAWRGTRYLNNRYLYRFRSVHNGLYRLLLSEVHYAIRGIAPRVLRNLEEFTTYLSSMVLQTVEFIEQFEDVNPLQVTGRIESIAHEFKAFAEEAHGLSIEGVDIPALVQEVLAEFTGVVDSRTIYTPTQAF